MAQEIVLPQWGMEMQDATVVRWLKQEGDPVQEGEPLVELETAKIATELESIASGVVAHILVPEGATVPIRTVLAIVAAPGEQVARPAGAAPSGTAARATAPATSSRTAAPPVPTEVAVQVTPAARHLARQHGLDLRRVQGTGPRGRILIEDVQKALEVQSQPTAQPAQIVPIRGMRQTIATRMVQSLQTMAQVTITAEVDVTEAMTLRAGLDRQWPESGLSPLHLVIKATARALKEHPRMNAVQKEHEVELVQEIHIGVAVSLEEGLLVPTIHRADAKHLAQIVSESRDLATKAREGRASYDEVTGGTFTITNLGAYGIDAFTPIINPPQVGILGMGRVIEKPAVYQGEIAKRSMMFLSLTFDHRVIDGAPAAAFLHTLKGHLEDPWWMVAAVP
jgi:pyruvate dehydrogenase E2 component (dihydrolipoyllysine-residue acetyltransferase)